MIDSRLLTLAKACIRSRRVLAFSLTPLIAPTLVPPVSPRKIYFWIDVQIFGRLGVFRGIRGLYERRRTTPDRILAHRARPVALLYDFEFEVEFFTAADGREIKLPEFSGEPKRRPTLIEVDEEFEPHRAPEICQTYVSCHRFQLGGGVERKRRACRHEASERVTVEVITMCRIGGPIRIRIMRSYDL